MPRKAHDLTKRELDSLRRQALNDPTFQAQRADRKQAGLCTTLNMGLVSVLAAFLLFSSSYSTAQNLRWESTGPGCGDVTAIAFSSNRVYAAGDPSGGLHDNLFLSENNGKTWKDTRSQPPGRSITSIAIHPDSDRILLVAGDGVWRSNNLGRKWKERSKGLPRSPNLTDLTFDPRNTQVLYVLDRSRGQLFKTTNGGKRWREIGPGQGIDSYVMHPRRPEHLWAIASRSAWRSRDGGRNWTETEGFPGGDRIAVDPSASETLYLAERGTIYKTTNGSTWTRVGVFDFGAFNRFLSVDPEDPSHLLVGVFPSGPKQSGIWRSTDGGKRWRPAGLNGLEGTSLGWSPTDPGSTLIGTNAGVYRVKRSGGEDTPSSIGLNYGRTMGLATSGPGLVSSQRSISYVATDFCGMYARKHDRLEWTSLPSTHNPGDTALAVSPVAPKVLYRGARSELWISADAGLSWTKTGFSQGGRIFDVAVSRVNPMRVYALVEYAGLYISDDGGLKWRLIDLIQAGFPNWAWVVAPHPADPDTLLIADGLRTGISVDGGSSWSVTGDLGAESISFDAHDPLTVYAVGSSSILKSGDGGDSWSVLPNGPQARYHSVLTDYFNRGTVYLSTSTGIYRSQDQGASWSRFGRGLPESPSIFPAPRTRLALTSEGELLLASWRGVYSTWVK